MAHDRCGAVEKAPSTKRGDDDDTIVSWEEFQAVRTEMLAELDQMALGVAKHRARAVLREGIREGRPLAEVAAEATAAGGELISAWERQSDLALPDMPAGRWH